MYISVTCSELEIILYRYYIDIYYNTTNIYVTYNQHIILSVTFCFII